MTVSCLRHTPSRQYMCQPAVHWRGLQCRCLRQAPASARRGKSCHFSARHVCEVPSRPRHEPSCIYCTSDPRSRSKTGSRTAGPRSAAAAPAALQRQMRAKRCSACCSATSTAVMSTATPNSTPRCARPPSAGRAQRRGNGRRMHAAGKDHARDGQHHRQARRNNTSMHSWEDDGFRAAAASWARSARCTFWGSFDLAVTRFSGRAAPLHSGGVPGLPDAVTREAYSHQGQRCPALAGQRRVPSGGVLRLYLSQRRGSRGHPIEPAAAHWSAPLGEWLLPYDAVRTSRGIPMPR